MFMSMVNILFLKSLVKKSRRFWLMSVKGRPKADLLVLDSSINNKFRQRGPVAILFHSPLKKEKSCQ